MSDFMSIAIRARMLKQAMRDGDFGLGVPSAAAPGAYTGPTGGVRSDYVPHTPPSGPLPFSAQAWKSKGPTLSPPSRLASLLKGRGGKLGLLGAGATGLAGLAGAFNSKPPAPPPEAAPEVVPEPVPVQPKLTAREKLRGMLHGKTRDAAGTFWNRMTAKYGRRPGPVSEDLA